MMAVLTHRDLDILETLTRRLRLLAIAQVQRVWWPTHMSCRVARRRMRQLAVAGLVCRTIVNAHPLLPVEGPLGVWQPGDGEPEDREPNAHRISRQDRDRWRQSSGPIEVFTATRRTANLFGSTAGRLPPMLHRDHDLLLAQVFTFYRTFRPEEARRWLGEDALPKAGYRIKDPDAFLVGVGGRPSRVIESAGRYAPAQITSFHAYCVEYDLAYELW